MIQDAAFQFERAILSASHRTHARSGVGRRSPLSHRTGDQGNIARGMRPEQATRGARMDFGGEQSVKEEYRAVRGDSFVESALQDVRFGVRMLRRSPGLANRLVYILDENPSKGFFQFSASPANFSAGASRPVFYRCGRDLRQNAYVLRQRRCPAFESALCPRTPRGTPLGSAAQISGVEGC